MPSNDRTGPSKATRVDISSLGNVDLKACRLEWETKTSDGQPPETGHLKEEVDATVALNMLRLLEGTTHPDTKLSVSCKKLPDGPR